MIIEIRTYRLRPGTADEFVRVMQAESLPLLADAGIKVVACGRSLAADDGHEEAYLVRAFDSVERRERQEQDFYGSEAWRAGPRAAIMACVESYHTVVVDAADLRI
ncbi:NIPSNAP family protein [Nocardioides speluncae]|uniref:NIPSNAP family protein n=1 Tax=Nocardioides speluncae TaxID=2670337 RepID=UPI000D69F285|nr:NIPSNAP family protein [Nocardioides speluncae]